MIIAHLSYADAIALKVTCSTFHAVLDIPTEKGFFRDPKYYTNTLVKHTLLEGLGKDARLQPCHYSDRFRSQNDFAANQYFDDQVAPKSHKTSKNSL